MLKCHMTQDLMRQLISVFIPNQLDYCNSLRTAMVEYNYCSTPVYTECCCVAHLGPIIIRPRHFSTPDVTLAPHPLSDPVQDSATYVHCTHWLVSEVHQWHHGTCHQWPQSTVTMICHPISLHHSTLQDKVCHLSLNIWTWSLEPSPSVHVTSHNRLRVRVKIKDSLLFWSV